MISEDMTLHETNYAIISYVVFKKPPVFILTNMHFYQKKSFSKPVTFHYHYG